MTTLTTITPHQAWLALVVVSALSYASYLAQRYWAGGRERPVDGGVGRPLFVDRDHGRAGAAGESRIGDEARRRRRASRSPPRSCTCAFWRSSRSSTGRWRGHWRPALRPVARRPFDLRAAISVCRAGPADADAPASALPASGGNPLSLVLRRCLLGCLSRCRWSRSGSRRSSASPGIYSLAAIVGITDIDPFVLNLAQGGASGMSNGALAAAILIAASSNNILKAIYAAGFRRRTRRPPEAQPRSSCSLLPAWASPSRPGASGSGNRESLTRRAMVPAPTPPARRPLG